MGRAEYITGIAYASVCIAWPIDLVLLLHEFSQKSQGKIALK